MRSKRETLSLFANSIQPHVLHSSLPDLSEKLRGANELDSVTRVLFYVKAWEILRRTRLCPTSRTDFDVLNNVFESEGRFFTHPPCPDTDSVEAFCNALDDVIGEIFSAKRFTNEQVADFSLEDWRFVFVNLLPANWDFVRMISLASVKLPASLSVPIFENLYDEAGGCGRTAPHRDLYLRMLRALGANVVDPDTVYDCRQLEFLSEVVPGAIVEPIVWSLLLYQQGVGGIMGALYSVELGVPDYFEDLEKALRKHGLDSEALEYLCTHQSTDVEHAREWRNTIAKLIDKQPNLKPQIWKGAVLSASADLSAWAAIMSACKHRRSGQQLLYVADLIRPTGL